MFKTLRDEEHVAHIGVIIALLGLGQLIAAAIASFFVLFFGAVIMCGTAIYMLPYAFFSIVLGWSARHRNPKIAWLTIIIGILLVPLALLFAFIYGEIVGRATA